MDGAVMHHIHGVIEERMGVLYSTTDNDHNCWGLAPRTCTLMSAFGQRLTNI